MIFPSHLAIFDLDFTLIKANSTFLFCQRLYHLGILSSFSWNSILMSYACYRMRFLSLSRLFDAVLKKMVIKKNGELFKTILEDLLTHLSSLFYFPAFSRLRAAQHLGHYTVILSASPHFIVEKIAKFLQVDECRGSFYDEKNFEINKSLMDGEQKKNYVLSLRQRFNLEKEQISAYSDSYVDLPLLLASGYPVAVNPDTKLKRFFTKKQWEIL
jgi:HAD superfamily hydrolase (TIGR01490 family)